jgi:RNA polymerase sigma-70 factor (ECF subfamily)
MPPELDDAYRRYFPALVRKCSRMLRDEHEAQDVAQESFLRLCQSDLVLSDVRVVTAWLYRTSTRLALDRLRARGQRGAEPMVWEETGSASAPDEQLHLRGLWAELLRRVPADELEAALLFRADGLRQAEIAEVLGVHERSVRRLLAQFEARVERLRARSER